MKRNDQIGVLAGLRAKILSCFQGENTALPSGPNIQANKAAFTQFREV